MLPNNSNGLPPLKVQQVQFYQGSVPHPDILKGLKEIDSSYPDRVFKIAEEAAAERIRASKAATENAKSLVESEKAFKSRGQILTFILFMLVLAVTVTLAIMGMPGPAVAACIGGFATIGVSAINGMTGRK